jgi:hypothetical protein
MSVGRNGGRDGRNWDRQLEGGLPDSRLRGTERENKTIVYAHQLWERVFCANCGRDGGLVTAGWSAFVFYVCDECAAKCGPPPGAVEAPAAAVRGGAQQ